LRRRSGTDHYYLLAFTVTMKPVDYIHFIKYGLCLFMLSLPLKSPFIFPSLVKQVGTNIVIDLNSYSISIYEVYMLLAEVPGVVRKDLTYRLSEIGKRYPYGFL